MDMIKLRAWWWHRQGLDGSLPGAEPGDVLARTGWARSVGGSNPYLSLFARAGTAGHRSTRRSPPGDLRTSLGPRLHLRPAGRTFRAGAPGGAGRPRGRPRVLDKLGVDRGEVDKLCARRCCDRFLPAKLVR